MKGHGNKKVNKVFVKYGSSEKDKSRAEEKIYNLLSSGYKRLSDNGHTAILTRIR